MESGGRSLLYSSPDRRQKKNTGMRAASIDNGFRMVPCLDMSREPESQPGRPIPETGYCEEKNRLLNEFLKKIHDLNTLQAAQTQAVIDGDTDFNRFDVLLHMAQEKKESAKYAWMAHVESHRCGG